MDEVIPGRSLVLRIWRSDDRESLAAIRDRSLQEFADWLPGAMRDLADLPAFLDHVAWSYREASAFFYAIVENGQPVGQCSLHYRDPGEAEIGYWVRTDRTGRGLATEAVLAVSAAAFASGIGRLVIHCDAGNTRSAAVARKAGFAHVETRRVTPDRPPTRAQTGWEMTWVRPASCP